MLLERSSPPAQTLALPDPIQGLTAMERLRPKSHFLTKRLGLPWAIPVKQTKRKRTSGLRRLIRH
jgi:hypothetical protein